VAVVGRGCVRKHEAGEGLRTEYLKSSCWGSISGAPLEMGVENGVGRWYGGADEVVVVVGYCVRKREAREGG
jgi:hypothetical protein